MAENGPRSTLVQKLTLLVLILILGCQAAILFKSNEQTGFPPKPPLSTAPMEMAPLEPPVQTPPAKPTQPAIKLLERSQTTTNVIVRNNFIPVPRTSPPFPPRTESSDRTPASVSNPGLPVPAAESPAGTAITPVPQGLPVLRYTGQPVGSEMRIDGKATGKKWDCVGKIITGSFEMDAAFQWDGKGSAPICSISIPIRTLKSSGGPIMDKRMLAEMNAERFPKIEFKVTSMVLRSDEPSSGPVTYEATGSLAIAGVTNTVRFPIVVEAAGANGLKFSGSMETKMTDFKITPPEFSVGGMGMKTEDAIKLTWVWNTLLSQ